MRTITFILIAIVALGGLSACKQTVTPPVNPTAMSTATAPPSTSYCNSAISLVI